LPDGRTIAAGTISLPSAFRDICKHLPRCDLFSIQIALVPSHLLIDRHEGYRNIYSLSDVLETLVCSVCGFSLSKEIADIVIDQTISHMIADCHVH
jgi:hypothetical protein